MKTHFVLNNFFFEYGAVYEIMSNNEVGTEGPQMTSQYGAYSLRVELAKLHSLIRTHTPTRPGTHTDARTHNHAHTDQYVALITFPPQQWFSERALLLRYSYFACLVQYI